MIRGATPSTIMTMVVSVSALLYHVTLMMLKRETTTETIMSKSGPSLTLWSQQLSRKISPTINKELKYRSLGSNIFLSAEAVSSTIRSQNLNEVNHNIIPSSSLSSCSSKRIGGNISEYGRQSTNRINIVYTYQIDFLFSSTPSPPAAPVEPSENEFPPDDPDPSNPGKTTSEESVRPDLDQPEFDPEEEVRRTRQTMSTTIRSLTSAADISSILENRVIDTLIPKFFPNCLQIQEGVKDFEYGDGNGHDGVAIVPSPSPSTEGTMGYHYYDVDDPRYGDVTVGLKTSPLETDIECDDESTTDCVERRTLLIIYMHNDRISSGSSGGTSSEIAAIRSIISTVMEDIMTEFAKNDDWQLFLTLSNVKIQEEAASEYIQTSVPTFASTIAPTMTPTLRPTTEEEKFRNKFKYVYRDRHVNETHFTFHDDFGDNIYSYAWLSAIGMYVIITVGVVVCMSRRKLVERRKQFEELLKLEKQRQNKMYEKNEEGRGDANVDNGKKTTESRRQQQPNCFIGIISSFATLVSVDGDDSDTMHMNTTNTNIIMSDHMEEEKSNENDKYPVGILKKNRRYVDSSVVV